MQGNFILADGHVCDNSQYGKYGCHLTIIRDGAVDDIIKWGDHQKLIDPMNLPVKNRSALWSLRGEFFTSKKGTKMFRLDPSGKHLLLQYDWGGAFNSDRGGCLPENGALYTRRASSNGGGSGYDYAVYPLTFRYVATIDDL